MLIAVSLLLVGCKDTPQGDGTSSSGSGSSTPDKPVVTPANVTHTSWQILEGKPTQTTVHKYVTDKPGPKIVIVGGIHGDEVAGWTAALRLVNTISQEEGICGEILLIPQANILADNARVRYNVKGTGVSYSDLNRSFEIGRQSTAKKATIEISDALVAVVDEFIGEYKYQKDGDLCIIDFHESLGSWTDNDGRLGDELLTSNTPFLIEELLDRYNKNYKPAGDPNFRTEDACKQGSFSLNFSKKYRKATVFTIETNRGNDTVLLEKRVSQQLNIMQALFDIVWERI